MDKEGPTNSNTPPTSPKSGVKKVGGFAVGDHIIVAGKGSTYFGKKGVVQKFCDNGSRVSLHVKLDGDKKTHCLRTKSLEHATPDVEFSTGSTQSDVESLATDTSRGRRVLTLYEFLEDLKAEYKENKDLYDKLNEVIKLVLAINV